MSGTNVSNKEPNGLYNLGATSMLQYIFSLESHISENLRATSKFWTSVSIQKNKIKISIMYDWNSN